MNNVGTERGLIAPRRGCAIYLQLSRSDAISFVTSAADESLRGCFSGRSVSRFARTPTHEYYRTFLLRDGTWRRRCGGMTQSPSKVDRVPSRYQFCVALDYGAVT